MTIDDASDEARLRWGDNARAWRAGVYYVVEDGYGSIRAVSKKSWLHAFALADHRAYMLSRHKLDMTAGADAIRVQMAMDGVA